MAKKRNKKLKTHPRCYVIQVGDTLYDIATAHNVTLHDLEAYNPCITDFNVIYPGQQISIPFSSQPQASYECYIVKAGDTEYGIARDKNISTQALEACNPCFTDWDHLTTGQELNIPVNEQK